MYTYKIKLDRVIDGDTIDAIIDLGFDVSVKKRIRFLGINTPESRTRDLEEKARGLAAKERLKIILEGANIIQLCSHGVGKYGRCLGELFIDCPRLNNGNNNNINNNFFIFQIRN